MGVFSFAVGRHRHLKDARRTIAYVSEEQITIVVHGASRNIVRQAGRMLELGDFLALQRFGIETPYHALNFLL